MAKKILIVSSCVEDWGGSEELWGKSIPYFQKDGFNITVAKYYINFNHPAFVKLKIDGVELIEIFPQGTVVDKVKRKLKKVSLNLAMKFKLIGPRGEDFSNFIKIISNQKPDLVIISQGINFDGLKLAYQCALLKVPYVVVSQKAVDFYWPHKDDRAYMLEALQKAEKCYFVSKHNLRLTEEQFGQKLENGEVIFNPNKISGKPLPFPKTTPYKLACVGRLFLLDKGQDILIRILSSQKWQQRPIEISFVGKGTDEIALKDLAKFLKVKNVNFVGQMESIEAVWKDHHALILPSRSEGLPLSMVEAMSAGRPVIISNAGGNAELLEEGKTGFIGHANEESFDEAMERAWNKRAEWEEIGLNASKFISENVPKAPEEDFAKLVLNVIDQHEY